MQTEPKKSPPEPKRMGRPPQAEVQKKSIEISLDEDFVIIKVPRKDLTKKLLADLL